jgi:septal ring factor EnvC (AmiA/AmiB activator)
MRSALANLEGRMPGRRINGVCFFRLPFFSQEKKGDSLGRRPSESFPGGIGQGKAFAAWWSASCLLLAGILLCAAGAQAQSADSPHATQQEIEAKQKLDQVRVEIHRIIDEQRETSALRNEATAELRARELAVAQTVRDLRVLDQKLVVAQGRMDELVRSRDALDASLASQRGALAALLRSAYALGRNEELRLLLLQDDAAAISRMLAYYRYFERARVGEIQRLLADLDALAQVQKAIAQQTESMRQARDARGDEVQRLEDERNARAQALAMLEVTLKDQSSRLAALGRDEKSLLELIAKLHDIFADIPRQIAGAEPFAQTRGRLAWPLRGIAQVAARQEGDAHGVLIAANEGSEVLAVSHGRVVFADWLRGYGLLLIVDHGDGYLSLYGCNETLLKDVGDWVDGGDVIATSGTSGGRKTPGLYFELRHDGKPLDVHAWLRPSSRPH